MKELIILAKDFSVPMALVDFIPVILFLLGGIILIDSLGNKMNKTQFSLFSSGIIFIVAAGALKATYKLLYAANICDFDSLNKMFFPTQSIGFLLAGIGLILFVIKTKNSNKLLNVAPPVFSGTFLFVGFMCGGLLLMDIALCILSKKVKKCSLMILFIISFVCSLCMGYLSSQDFEQAAMNWIAEGVNVVGQTSFFVGAYLLRKNGLKELIIGE